MPLGQQNQERASAGIDAPEYTHSPHDPVCGFWLAHQSRDFGGRSRPAHVVSIPDVLNIVSILTVLALAVIRPLALRNMLSGNTFRFPASARAAFAAGFVLLVCHPLSMVAHYGLLNK